MSKDTATESASELLALAKRQPQVVGPDEHMFVARRLMEQFGISHLPVLEEERVVGMISGRDMLRCPWAHLEPSQAISLPDVSPPQVRYWMNSALIPLTTRDDLQSAIRKLLERHISGLPIVGDREELLAIITERDLVWHFARRRPADDDECFCPVVDHMSHDVLAVSPTSTLQHAVKIFTERSIRHLPVVHGQEVVGMLSDRNILKYLSSAISNGRPALEAINDAVSQAMSSPADTVNHLFTILQTAQIMRERNIRALPVLQSGRLIGIFTTTDVLKFAASRSTKIPT